jgi:subtilisin family serine protease
MRRIRLLSAALAIAASLSTPPLVAAGATSAADAPGLSARLEALGSLARSRGAAPVIVQFDEFGPPLPTLPPAAQAARVQDIRDKANRLLADLQGWGRIANVKKFDYTPQLALHVDERTLDVLARHPMVVDIVEDRLKAPVLAQTAPLMNVTTNAWGAGWTGAGQVVAILDSGVDKTHPFLAGKVVSEACYSTSSTNYGSTTLCPAGTESSTAAGSGVNCTGASGCEHGTHVAGIAAGRDPGGLGYSGVAKDASLVAIQVFSRFDSSTYCGSSTPCILSWDSDQIEALQRVLWLKQNGTNIASANMSLGGGRAYAYCDTDSLKPTIDSLRAAGVAVAIAAGNNGYTDSLSEPACISSAISVGSTCDYAGGSYCGGGVDGVAGYSNIASFVSLVAPGSAVTSSVPGGGYQAWHGTSMATPQVAGAWAVRRQQAPAESVTDTLAWFRANAVLLNDNRTGGSVTGLRRVQFVATEPPPPPANYTLTVNVTGTGTVTSTPAGISCAGPATCSSSYEATTSVTLTAAPGDGQQFSAWSGACSGSGTTCTLSMDASKSASAAFIAAPVATAPAAPSNFTAKPVARQRIQLAWTDNSSNETSFVLTRTGGTSGKTINLAANTVQYTDSSLTRGIKYTYTLEACNANGCSAKLTASATAK